MNQFNKRFEAITDDLLLCDTLVASDVWKSMRLSFDKIDEMVSLAWSIDDFRYLIRFASSNAFRILRRDSCKNAIIVEASISSNPIQIETSDNITRMKRNAINVGKNSTQGSGLTKPAGAFPLFPSALKAVINHGNE